MATFDQHAQQVAGPQYNADRITIYQQAIPRPVDPETLAAAERQLAALPLEMIPNPAPLPPGSRMPLRRNPLFVGLEADLQALATALKGGETAAIGQTAAASGLGGIGKTQLASEFVHRYGQFFAGGVFWLSFSEPAAVPTEVAACGGPGAVARHPEFHTLPMADQVQLMQAAWQSPLPRLLVFDNCEEEALLAQWRPPHEGCRVLVTSRRAQWEATFGVQALPLGILQRGESLALLRHHRPDLSADDADLNALAAELGDLPLALHLAGSFLARYRYTVTPATYLTQLQQPNLLAYESLQGRTLTRDLSPTQHEPHVKRTFGLSYDRLDPADPTDASALALLADAAYFAPGLPIPQVLLLATAPQTPRDVRQAGRRVLRRLLAALGWASEVPDAAVQVEDALGRLLALGLLEPDAAGAVRLHRLLAVFVRAIARDATAQIVVEDVLLAEAGRLTRAGYPGPLLALHPHLRAVTEAAQPREDGRTAGLNMALGRALLLLGDYIGAQPAVERALALSERGLGPDHPKVATSLNNLAELYRVQGRYAEAKPLSRRALAIREQALGPSHLDVAQSLHDLALLYYVQGRYGEAEPLYVQALALLEQALSPDHPNIEVVRQNYLVLLRATDRHVQAQALEARARTGPTFPPSAARRDASSCCTLACRERPFC
jgi:tetratricopeptide (TPR) repeat protein